MNFLENIRCSMPLLAQVHRLRFLRAYELLAHLDLHPSQFHLLSTLNSDKGLSQQEIASLLMVKPSTLTVMIQRMEKNNLLIRIPDEKDKRVLRVYRTQKGAEVYKKGFESFIQVEQESFANLSDNEKQQLDTILEKIKANLQKITTTEEQSWRWC
jgi:DNA-binding MarR family transcriptional regulator